ncbi:indole-3-glycerol phosphate synthase TrpC [Oceanobacillus sp. CAU 1775]
MTILDKILAEKKKELVQLIHKPLMTTEKKDVPTFKSIVASAKHVNIISEIKRASPSKGAINLDIDPAEQARNYEQNGAAAISVLTDGHFFKGSFEDLSAVRKTSNLPILCKDFIIDTMQIDHANAAGANIILLIVAALSDEQLNLLNNYTQELGLEVLIEVHNEEEMHRALKIKPEIIGINNRDLKTFQVNLNTTEQLASMVDSKNIILISESGIKKKEDVEKVTAAGAVGILVGESLMQTENLQKTFKALQIPLLQKDAK